MPAHGRPIKGTLILRPPHIDGGPSVDQNAGNVCVAVLRRKVQRRQTTFVQHIDVGSRRNQNTGYIRVPAARRQVQ